MTLQTLPWHSGRTKQGMRASPNPPCIPPHKLTSPLLQLEQGPALYTEVEEVSALVQHGPLPHHGYP
eukprot:3747061-Lingulodinium_polyedra.AAC.1